MNEKIKILEERISAKEYIDFLKRTDLGSQYPKERFESRIATLVDKVSISLIARNECGTVVGVLFGLKLKNCILMQKCGKLVRHILKNVIFTSM